MSSIEEIPDVEIDANGRFKYILIKMSHNGKEKLVVRGFAWAEYHADILEEFEKNLNKQIETECVGGGRILHNSAKKEILVYGYSQGYGQADHAISVSLIKSKYPDYLSISFSNEGY